MENAGKSPLKIALHGLLLAAGMYCFSMWAISVFQQYHTVVAVIWVLILLAMGAIIRRKYWPEWTKAGAVIGMGMIPFFLFQWGLSFVFDSHHQAADVLKGFGTMIQMYGLWFWLPFTIGAALGGFIRVPSADQAE